MTRSQLVQLIFQRRSFLCIGLDTEIDRLPKHLLRFDDPVFEFNKQIIDATRELCVAYKPNLAFYESLGPKGWVSLQKTVEYIGNEHFIIADAKRGDIGNTARMYAKTFFESYHFDAVTVAPYMGEDSVTPFLSFPGKWTILLALTSNPGSKDFQKLPIGEAGQPLFEQVILKATTWGSPENLMLVVGATHPATFKTIRQIAPDHFFLVPGIGAQGGDLKTLIQHGMNKDCGLLINSSRAIIYAGGGDDFAEKAREAALEVQMEMAAYLSEIRW